MKYTDKIYGSVEIDETVIIEIINSKSFQRLKGIDQAGYFETYFPGTKHSRFEHSVGCFLLLKKFSASIEEQIAGLIHDVSHSAFSHTADYIFAQGRGADQNYQDDIFIDFIRRTEIPEILQKYGFDVDFILNEDNFPLQETELPNLCADRIDYFLRSAVAYDNVDLNKIQYFLNHLKIINNEWVLDSLEVAMAFAKLFKKLNDKYYSGKESGAMFLRTSEWIKYAVDKKYIKQEDLFVTDREVIEQINKNDDIKLQQLWKEMNNPNIILCNKRDNECKEVIVKSRIVDPLFESDGVIKRLSDIDGNWARTVKEGSKPKTYYLRLHKC